MKILGNRILISKIEEEKKEGFQTVEVQDSFVNKGKVEMLGEGKSEYVMYSSGGGDGIGPIGTNVVVQKVSIGDIILFAKYSPDTQDIKHEGRDMKIVNVDDILAIL